MIDRIARVIVTTVLRRVRKGELRVVEGARDIVLGEPGALEATITIRNPRAWRAFLRGSFGLAISYIDGYWESDDIVALTRIAARNVRGIDRIRALVAPVWRPIQRGARRVHAPTIGRSRRQIAAHYDLGNELFALFLDETLSYSSALFERLDSTLYDASIAKLDAVCRKLELAPGDQVLEIGSGWGAFAIHAAANYGARVTTTTISERQFELATLRVRDAGLSDRIAVLLSDYRELEGRYDKLVSIEMIEAVGWQYFETYFRGCSRLLKPDGAMLLQAITIDDAAYEVEKGSRSFINTLVFPGGCLPSIGEIDRCVKSATDMVRIEHHDMTDHYVRTLQHWRARFAQANRSLLELGYDERFQRLWNLYLAYSEGGFAERRIRVGQFLLGKPEHSGGRGDRERVREISAQAAPTDVSGAAPGRQRATEPAPAFAGAVRPG